ncbi:MAG: purine-binding chemotaxis protein CheW, partial [bacterium]|nr:purine-binding chemotaxis protein CheW [bacterium]
MQINKNGFHNPGETSSAHEIQLISFKVSGEEFGVKIDKVKEILKLTGITPIPRAPAYLLGMMNMRGTIIPVLDLKNRLNQGIYTPSGSTRILVLSVSGDLSG